MLVTLCTVVICRIYCLIVFLYQYINYFVCVHYNVKKYNLIQLNHLKDAMYTSP